MNKKEIASYVDHTLLKQNAVEQDFVKLCDEAKKYGFAAVCVQPSRVALCKKLLQNSEVKIASVIGFPMGVNTTEVKAFETAQAVCDGADEIDMVINVGKFLEGDFDYTARDIKAVVETAGKADVKVIIETSLLTKEQIVKISEIVAGSGAAFIKTSTGYFGTGATVPDVALMKKTVGNRCKVKAAGGIRDYATALAMIEAGAERIGASAGVKIVEECEND